MGVLSDFFHLRRAKALERSDRLEEAAEHLLQLGGRNWDNYWKVASMFKAAGRNRAAIRYFRQAASARGSWEFFLSPCLQCYEAEKDYLGALELHFEVYRNMEQICDLYLEYLAKKPSLLLPKDKLLLLFSAYFTAEYWGYDYSKEKRRKMIEEVKRAGLTKEILSRVRDADNEYRLRELTVEFGHH